MNLIQYTQRQVFTLFFLFSSSSLFAASYQLPSANESLIGAITYSSTRYGESIASIAQKYDIGFNSFENANPQVNAAKSFLSGETIQVPTQHLLPNQKREGIVINLPEMRMYYFVDADHVLTYPIGIGKIGKTIPITRTSITKKTKNPVWIPPADIRQFNLEQGIVLPKIMPAGPDNPLGPYAIYMRLPTYLIHSTIFPESVGKRASFGCIRMYESDIEDFFPSITKGIPVAIINSPVKVGWQENKLYVEVHPSLEEHQDSSNLPGMVHLVSHFTQDHPTLVDWQMLYYAAQEKDGLPHEAGIRLPE